MKFPIKKFEDPAAYWVAYIDEMYACARSVDGRNLIKAADALAQLFVLGGTLYACGNGGSASIANHLLCDFIKGVQTDTHLRPRVVSLSSHVELITAIGNDIAFEDIFAYQLRTAARPGDILMSISSSGDSENIVRAVDWARANGLKTIALTGFGGGRSAGFSEINIHVPAGNYGVIEDLHQSIMHVLAQFIRMRLMDSDLVAERKF